MDIKAPSSLTITLMHTLSYFSSPALRREKPESFIVPESNSTRCDSFEGKIETGKEAFTEHRSTPSHPDISSIIRVMMSSTTALFARSGWGV